MTTTPYTTGIMPGDRANDHAWYVAEVAKAAFPYPNDEFPDRSTHINLPEITVEVPLPGESEDARPASTDPPRGIKVKAPIATPEIVVLDGPSRHAVACGEVIGSRDNIEEEIERWRPVTEVSTLFVFVPVGAGSEAKKSLKKHGVQCELRTYRWTPLGVEINRV